MLHTVTICTRGPIFVLSLIQHKNYRMSHKSSLTGNTVFVAGWIKHNGWHIWEVHCWTRQKLSFCMPLALANNRQLKNFTLVIPADCDLDRILLIKFIHDFRSSSNKSQIGGAEILNWWWKQYTCTCHNHSEAITINEKDCIWNCTHIDRYAE